jgi:fermentation-respiration switch protein FrsA (DUF1100 family)
MSLMSRDRMKLALSIVVVGAIALYVLLSPPVAWGLYKWLLFHPVERAYSEDSWVQIEREFGVKRTEVSYRASNGDVISGWFFRLPGAKRVFLVSQGKGSRLEYRGGIVRMLLKCGGSVLIYNYGGIGRSVGEASLDGVCADAVASYDFLVEQEKYAPADIVAYGESFGTGVTGQLVSRRKVGAVILQSGFTSLLRASRDVLPWLRLYPDWCFPKQMLDNVAVFGKSHAPLLIVHGQEDGLVSVANARELFAAAVEPKELLILRQGEHGKFGSGNEYFDKVKAFLDKYDSGSIEGRFNERNDYLNDLGVAGPKKKNL